MSAMASISNHPTSTTTRREKKADIYKRFPAIFNDFSKILAAITAAKSSFISNQIVMISLVIMTVVYFIVLVLRNVIQPYITNHLLLPILSCIILLLASAASVLALILIEPTKAFIIAILWVAVFVLVSIFHRHELCEFMSSVTEKVKNLIWRENL